MKLNTRNRIVGALSVVAVLLTVGACGTETLTDTDPGTQPPVKARPYPPTEVPVWTPKANPGPTSPDAAERRAKAEQERQDHASTMRWDRGNHEEGRLKPAQP